jgi:hypothetical protein
MLRTYVEMRTTSCVRSGNSSELLQVQSKCWNSVLRKDTMYVMYCVCTGSTEYRYHLSGSHTRTYVVRSTE